MCGLCPDTIAGCDKIECGALLRLDENGVPRKFYMHWFVLGQTPCEHALEGHLLGCELFEGRDCNCKELKSLTTIK